MIILRPARPRSGDSAKAPASLGGPGREPNARTDRARELAALLAETPLTVEQLRTHPITGQWPRVVLAIATQDLTHQGDIALDSACRFHLTTPITESQED